MENKLQQLTQKLYDEGLEKLSLIHISEPTRH